MSASTPAPRLPVQPLLPYQALECAPFGCVLVGTDDKIRLANSAARLLLDLPDTGRGGVALAPCFSEAHRGSYLTALALCAAADPGAPPRRQMLTCRNSDGVRLELNLEPLRGLDGEPAVAVYVTDAPHEGFRASRFELAIEYASEGIVIASREGRINTVNSSLLAMFQYQRTELLGADIELLLPEAARLQHVVHRQRYMEAPTVRAMGTGMELFGLRKNGEEFPIEIGMAPLGSVSGSDFEVMLTIVDVSKRRQAELERSNLEFRLQQSQKLESLAVLSGGIAHDFNNILTGILGSAELAQMECAQGSSIDLHLANVIEASLRAAELCERMLAYSGGHTRKFADIDLNALVRSTLALVQSTIERHTTVNLKLGTNLPTLLGDEVQMRQVLMNLLTNAAEALEGRKGCINVSTGVRWFDATDAGTVFDPHASPLPARAYAYVTVADNGIGMSPEVLKRIFEPFFTTKFTGRGLGLAAVLGIVRSHAGGLRIASTPGQGTAFTVLLPFDEPEQDANERGLQRTRERGTVLLVDDEELVHKVLGATLRKLGLSVISCRHGKEGLEAFAAFRQQLKLVILDITMPVMGGREACAEIRKLDAEIPVVIISGFSAGMLAADFAGLNVTAFLQKPLAPRVLADQVYKILP